PQGVKIAELNSQARALMKAHHMPLRDKLISQTTLMGKAMAPVAGLANAALQARPIRALVEAAVGIHRQAPVPKSAGRPFHSWWKSRPLKTTPSPLGPVVFFHGCAGDYFEVETSIKSVEVLEHIGHQVIVPGQGCCGLAQQSNGLYQEASANVIRLCRSLNQAGPELTIISSSGSCTGMLKHEAREIMGVTDPALAAASTRVRDIMEHLLDLHHQGQLPRDLKPNPITVPYHAPCQLKGQGMGMPALDVLRLIPELTVVESGRACCGIAGTYGLKKEKYDVAQAVGRPLFDMITQTNPKLALCDTETCRWQLRQGTGAQVEHPIWLIHKAYGLS
ncbi:MAG: anaerobic glycerol-3-phosphate dehydrogenase subunit C, partial [Propionibacteriaceae bacterium]|nr:anaerobic glycerol-3-phosphate dehydrogenase subunit C [Propionibacteriaceae bacterium]